MPNFLNENEKKDLLNLSKLWMKANEEILNTILNRGIKILPPTLLEKPIDKETQLLKNDDFLSFPLTISSGLLGNFYIVFAKSDLAVMIDLIIGGDGTSPMKEFDELHMSVLEEAINQIAATLESIISENLSRNINVRLGKPDAALKKLFVNWEMVCLNYKLEIEPDRESQMEVLIPTDFSHELISQISSGSMGAVGADPRASQIGGAKNAAQGGAVMHRKAMFAQFTEDGGATKETKLDMIMDIPLELTVVLGKTGISVKELMTLGPGSILELEKLAGEPVEIFVNDRLVAYGEVIVIEESFGVRVIDLAEGAEVSQPGGKKR